MTMRTRKLVGTILLFILITVYAFLAMMVAIALQVNASPLVEVIYYVVAGLAWGYVMYEPGASPGTGTPTFTVIAGSFLVLPLVGALGLDLVLLGAGIGCYIALFSTDPHTENPAAHWSVPALFILLGLRIPLMHILVLGPEGWILIGIVTVIALAVRVLAFGTLSRAFDRMSSRRDICMAALPAGPIAILFLHRFLPGCAASSGGETVVSGLYTIFSGTIFAMVCVATIAERLTRPRISGDGAGPSA